MEQNRNDFLACFTKGLHHKYKCHVFFGPNEGPHFHKHWNGMPKDWEVVIQAVEKNRRLQMKKAKLATMQVQALHQKMSSLLH